MPEEIIEKIADNSNMIIAGFAYTVSGNEIKVLNLNDTSEACVLSPEGDMLSANMDDVTLALVQAYYIKNRQFMEDGNA